MLINQYTVTVPESVNMAVVNSAVHYFHVGQTMYIRQLAGVVNGTTINSAADVEITVAIVGGAAIGPIVLPNGTAAGAGSQTAISPAVAIAPGTRLSVTVTTAATVAAGSCSVSLGVSNG